MKSMKNEFKIVIPLFLIFLIIYLLTCNHCLTLVLDSACYISDIARSDYVFSPHHLLYHAAFYHWNSFLNIFGSGDIVANLGSFNSIFGSLSVVVIYLILKTRFNISTLNSLIFAGIPAFSYGFWMVSTSVNVYAVSLFCQLLIFYLYLNKEETWKKWLIIGIVNGIAIVFNQWNIFIFLVITVNVLLDKQRSLLFKRYYWTYLFSSGILSLGAYLFILINNFKLYTLKSMLEWMTYYETVFEWTTSISKAIKEAIIGIGQTFVAPYWLFSFPGFNELIKDNLQSNVSFVEEAYFANSINATGSVILTILTIFLVIVIFIISIISLSNIKHTFARHRKETLYLFTWILLTSIMPFFWSGYNQRYWFIQTTAFYLFVFLSISVISRMKSKMKNSKIIYIVAAIMFTVNFFGVFKYSGDTKKDLTYCAVNEIMKKSKHGDMVIFKNIWTTSYYLDIYSGNLKWLNLHFFETRDKEKLRVIIRQIKAIEKFQENHDIIFTADIFENINDYPYELKSLLKEIRKKYISRMIYHKTEFINFYILSTETRPFSISQ
ncbi:MAG: glycosyltransferase family 39 protein [bacterium]